MTPEVLGRLTPRQFQEYRLQVEARDSGAVASTSDTMTFRSQDDYNRWMQSRGM